jgi:hypothetical protein
VLLALHGDGSFIVDRLITPLMQLLAHEVSDVQAMCAVPGCVLPSLSL